MLQMGYIDTEIITYYRTNVADPSVFHRALIIRMEPSNMTVELNKIKEMEVTSVTFIRLRGRLVICSRKITGHIHLTSKVTIVIHVLVLLRMKSRIDVSLVRTYMFKETGGICEH